jgi:hypothetical protein
MFLSPNLAIKLYSATKTVMCWILALLALTAFNSANAANITASVDRNPVNLEDSFKIYFTADESPDGDPDFSSLDEDFNVLGQSQSSSSSWVNGQYNQTVRWTLDVMAKKTGNLRIPAIPFGHDTSTPVMVTVNDTPAADNSANQDAQTDREIFLELKASPQQPLVQAQVIATVRLYRRVEISQASLSEPELSDAVVEKLGEDSNYSTVIQGVSYLVTERKYAIFPQKSGKITIKPLVLNAEVIVGGRRSFSDFFGSQMSKTKRVLSNELNLDVKPIPQAATGKHWLPVEKLTLTQEWSSEIEQLKVGEPITRTLTLTAEGTTVGQLPELHAMPDDTGIKSYPDQPVLNEKKSITGLTAVRQEKIALIPSAPGRYVLPAIKIPWYHTKTKRMEIAEIAEVEVNVIGSEAHQSTSAQPLLPTKPQANVQTQKTAGNAQQNNAASGAASQELPLTANNWFWISVLLATGWLVSLLYFLLHQQKNKNTNGDDATLALEKSNTQKKLIADIKAACMQDKPTEAKKALLAWSKHVCGLPSLAALAERSEARLRDEILILNRLLYSRNPGVWSGKQLYQAFTENNVRAKFSQNEDTLLEPLHRL